jgi:hypothetical protein
MSRALERCFPIWTWIVSPSTTKTRRLLIEPQAARAVEGNREGRTLDAGQEAAG